MRSMILAVPAVILLAGTAMAQTGSQPSSTRASNLPGSPITSPIAPSLPTPNVPQDKPSDFVQAAINALATGASGKAQQAMEMAQTRLLSRAVPIGQTNVPDTSPVIGQISQALQQLGAGDKSGSMTTLQTALTTLKAAGA